MKTPQDLSGDTIMLTFQFSLMFLIASQGSRLMYSTGDPMCYGCGLLTVVLLYKNAPGLIWGYYYVNFSVFTYVSDCFSRF